MSGQSVGGGTMVKEIILNPVQSVDSVDSVNSVGNAGRVGLWVVGCEFSGMGIESIFSLNSDIYLALFDPDGR